MKKFYLLLSIFISLFMINSFTSSAETVSYPFDSITIISAFTFEVEVAEAPNENSFLNGYVDAGETISIYVGELKYMYNGNEVEASESIIIVTNEDGTDIARWLINSFSREDNERTYQFSSHITIDPNVGVVKSDDYNNTKEAIVYISNSNIYDFTDNTDTTYSMIEDSLISEPSLNIVISVYDEGNNI